jgi:hypothetical protein
VTTTLLVDDQLLLTLLLGREPPDLRPDGAAVVTTGLWYHRLCRALADATVTGSMSRQLGHIGEPLAGAAIRAVIDLPESIGLVSLRTLGWPMADLLATGDRLNLLSLEALAAARHLGASVCLAENDDNLPLRAAAARHRVDVRLVPS